MNSSDKTSDQLLTVMEVKRPPAPQRLLETLGRELGRTLPADYRPFLIACSGGDLGGDYWFAGPTQEGKPADAGISTFGGFRRRIVPHLREVRDDYGGRIPNTLLWIADDPFGNAICVGIRGRYFGKVYC